MTVTQNEFQRFLHKQDITGICFESANGIYPVVKETLGKTTIYEEKIETDGKTEKIFKSVNIREKEGQQSCVIYQKIEISYATWVIKTVFIEGKMTKKIIFTTYNPNLIIGLPQ